MRAANPLLPLALLAALMSACSAPPPRAAAPPPDPTADPSYGEAVNQLAARAREAGAAFQHGRAKEAATTIAACRPLMDRLLSAPRPTLPAMQAVSDVDQLYGQLLLKNGQYVWARDVFQKNLIRWKTWKPPTPDTLRRLALARSAIAECDHHLLR